MSDASVRRRALISVSDKTEVVMFARGLRDAGYEIISTGGTARALREAGLDVIAVSDVTGFPEMMDGRVKTLHPAVHGALLGRRDDPAHMAAMEAHGIVPIDLVCINLYPFERTIRDPEVSRLEAIEQIDIGGPAMLRSASKNHDAITVVTSPNQYDRVISALREHGTTSLEMRRELAAAAFMRTAEYDTAIATWMSAGRSDDFPSMLSVTGAHRADLRYGENPHQRAALYADPASIEPNVVDAETLHGKTLSYNNLNDAAAALALVVDLVRGKRDRAAAAVIKHTNPCGAAYADDARTAFDRAYEGDPLAAYGGILAISRPVDDALAARIAEGDRFLEVIVAPSFDAAALERLDARWKNVRLLAVGALDPSRRTPIDLRSIPGGYLAQERDTKPARPKEWTHAAGPAATPETIEDACLAWMVVKHLTSNAIAIVAGGRLVGAGAGQMDRLAACGIAIEKAGERIGAGIPSVAASDAFFPFDDGPRRLIDAGVTCIVHPGGSKRDDDTLKLCNERGVTCILTGVRHFRH